MDISSKRPDVGQRNMHSLEGFVTSGEEQESLSDPALLGETSVPVDTVDTLGLWTRWTLGLSTLGLWTLSVDTVDPGSVDTVDTGSVVTGSNVVI
ncbi:unnamed protein product [Gadus morhua 'NCC']